MTVRKYTRRAQHQNPQGWGKLNEKARKREWVPGPVQNDEVMVKFIEGRKRKKGNKEDGEMGNLEQNNGLGPRQKFELMSCALTLAEKVRANAAQYSQNGQGQIVGEFLLLCSELEMNKAIGRITEKFDSSLFGNEKWERVRGLFAKMEGTNAP